jgi:GNAT superfamily N-acetyltransferase
MPIGDRTPLSEIKFVHGPRHLFERYFHFANSMAGSLGLRLALRTDFRRLVELNEQNAESWSPLSPIFNPAHCALDPHTAFWIEGVDEFGDTVATSAGRLYDHGTRSVADDLRSLRVFYDDPSPHLAEGECIEVTAASAEHICGRVMFSGAMWVRPDYRRHGLTRIIPRLTRSYAFAVWNAPLFWGGIEPDLHAVGVTRAYGSWHVEDGFTVHMPSWRRKLHFLFLSMGQATLVRDVAAALRQLATSNSRLIEAPMTNVSFRQRHGMSIRS